MAERNKFQAEIATGRLTLPVVILICLFLWGATTHQWQEVVSLLACSLTAYLLIETNTAFALIRTRTTLHVCFYVYLCSVCFFLHPWQPTLFVPLLVLLAFSQLFRSYESIHAPVHSFHAFLFLGGGSLLFPQLLFLIPFFYLGMISFRALSVKSFLAGLLGLTLPYWFLFGYALCTDRLEWFYRPLSEAVHFYPITYQTLTLQQWVSGGVIVAFSLISSMHYFYVSYLDKVRTRLFLSFLIGIEVGIYLLIFLQPPHFNVALHLLIMISAILGGHLFALTQSRWVGILFITTFVILMFLTIYNLWMQFFTS